MGKKLGSGSGMYNRIIVIESLEAMEKIRIRGMNIPLYTYFPPAWQQGSRSVPRAGRRRPRPSWGRVCCRWAGCPPR